MIKFFHRILGLLLATAITVTAGWWIISHTLGSATYLEAQADSSQVYQQVAASLPGSPGAELLRGQVQDFLPQLIAAITQSSPSAGVVLPGTTRTVTPVAPNSALAAVMRAAAQLGWLGPTAIIGLILLIAVACGARRWKVLSGAFLEAAVGLAITGGLLWLLPGFVMQNLSTVGWAALKPALEPFVSALLHGIASQFFWAALGAIANCLILLILHALAHVKSRFAGRRPPRPPHADFSKLPPAGPRLQS